MQNLFRSSSPTLRGLVVLAVALTALCTHQMVSAGTAGAFAGVVLSCAGLLALLIVAGLIYVVDVLKPMLEARTGNVATKTSSPSPHLTHRQHLELGAVPSLVAHALSGGDGNQPGSLVRAALDALTGQVQKARDPRDVASDPAGVLRVKAGEPLKTVAFKHPSHVTPADIEHRIAAEYSFTLDKALAGFPQVDGLDRVTLAVVVLRNGTKLVGVNYGAIDPARHDAEQGRIEARAAAIEQVWPLLGYELRTKLMAQE